MRGVMVLEVCSRSEKSGRSAGDTLEAPPPFPEAHPCTVRSACTSRAPQATAAGGHDCDRDRQFTLY